MESKGKVCVLGIWHLGSVYSACLADAGYSVVGWDPDANAVAELVEGRPAVFDPGLAELLTANIQEGHLTYTTDLAQAMEGARFVLITFDTPVDDRDEIDLSPVMETCRELAEHLEEDSILVVSSQVPVGTCQRMASTIRESRPSLRFDIACCPENLRLGQAIACFNRPDMIVVGADSPATQERVEELWAFTDAPKVRMSLRSAEMSKHALNAFLGMSISFSSELANLCDGLGADAMDVTDVLLLDGRIGKRAPLRPGLGFSGGTLARDLKILQGAGERLGCATILTDATLEVNDRQNQVVVDKLRKIYGSLKGLTVGVLGLTYKPDTSTLRRSVALEIIQELVNEGAAVKAYDPKANATEIEEHDEFLFCSNAYDAARDCDALVVITDWPEFRDLDFSLIRAYMKKPVLVDARNMLDAERLRAAGFVYLGIGRGMGQ